MSGKLFRAYKVLKEFFVDFCNTKPLLTHLKRLLENKSCGESFRGPQGA